MSLLLQVNVNVNQDSKGKQVLDLVSQFVILHAQKMNALMLLQRIA